MGLLYRIMDIDKSDIEEIEEWLFDCSIDESDLVDFLRNQLSALDCCVWDLSLKLIAFQYILTLADVIELNDYVEINPDTNEIKITAKKQIINDALSNILVEDRNDSWLFLVEYFGSDVLIEDQNN